MPGPSETTSPPSRQWFLSSNRRHHTSINGLLFDGTSCVFQGGAGVNVRRVVDEFLSAQDVSGASDSILGFPRASGRPTLLCQAAILPPHAGLASFLRSWQI
jgi:hypothetical protein